LKPRPFLRAVPLLADPANFLCKFLHLPLVSSLDVGEALLCLLGVLLLYFALSGFSVELVVQLLDG
jgi:hypothetical protein